MPILGSLNSAANKDMMATIWTYGDTIIFVIRKDCGKWSKELDRVQLKFCEQILWVRYKLFRLFPHCFQKQSVFDVLKGISTE